MFHKIVNHFIHVENIFKIKKNSKDGKYLVLYI